MIQFLDHVRPGASLIHQADKRGFQFNVGDVFHHIAGDSAMHLHNTAGIPSARNVLCDRVSLDIYK